MLISYLLNNRSGRLDADKSCSDIKVSSNICNVYSKTKSCERASSALHLEFRQLTKRHRQGVLGASLTFSQLICLSVSTG